MNRIVVVVAALLLYGPCASYAGDLSLYRNDRDENWTKKALEGRASLYVPELYEAEDQDEQQLPLNAKPEPPKWANMARAVGLSLEVAELIQDMSQRDKRRYDDKPEVRLMMLGLSAGLSLIPGIPAVQERMPKGVRIAIDVGDGLTGDLSVTTEIRWKFSTP